MAGVAMAGDGDTTSKCRAARRRRIEMRRVAAVAGDATSPRGAGRPREAEAVERAGGEKRARTAGTDPPPPPPQVPSSSSTSSSTYSVSSSGGGEASALALAAASTSAPAQAPASVVAFGSVAISGRTREMEDAVSLRPGFFRRPGVSPIHFFAVFDGHGGSHVSALCKERMHGLMAEELGRADEGEEGWWRAAVERSFGRMDELALRACACGRVEDPPCRCERSGIESDIVGSTAVVAVLSQERVLVANCGDSRAVLSRGGHSVPLSSDHKPDRPDELARIEAAGGRVIYLNGARVHGILAMSRALGDKYLKPPVISEPEIRIIERTPEDECLIIASDGLWDVLSNDMACDVARRCLAEGNPVRVAEDLSGGGIENSSSVEEEEQASDARCSLAAALLARLALGRKSEDNISVIVIDLRRG